MSRNDSPFGSLDCCPGYQSDYYCHLYVGDPIAFVDSLPMDNDDNVRPTGRTTTFLSKSFSFDFAALYIYSTVQIVPLII